MRRLVPLRHWPILATATILVALFLVGALAFEGFAAPTTIAGLFGEYAFLGIAALGATLVIVSGGIDLSVGAVVAFTSIFVASLVEVRGLHPLGALVVAVLVGALFGATMGVLIHGCALPPFLVTLAGMFFMRALGFLVREQSLSIRHPFYDEVTREWVLALPGGVQLPAQTTAYLALAGAVALVAGRTRFGRNVYALGGSEPSARLMGLPVGATKVGVYALAGALSAVAGFALTLYKRAGDPAAVVGLELEAIAAVVIGGTTLAGGRGGVLGTLMGVLILGLIRLLIDFHGDLNSAWTSVTVGLLLLVFVVLQNTVAALARRAPG